MDIIRSLCDPMPPQIEPRALGLSAQMRLQALILATMNRERAELCSKEHESLANFFYMNEKFLLEVSK